MSDHICDKEPFNGMTPAEAERLHLLMEECGEVIQAAAKVLRHGYEGFNPLLEVPIRNRDVLAAEMGDLWYAMHLVTVGTEDVDGLRCLIHSQIKAVNASRWLHHQKKEVLDDVTQSIKYQIEEYKKDC